MNKNDYIDFFVRTFNQIVEGKRELKVEAVKFWDRENTAWETGYNTGRYNPEGENEDFDEVDEL